MAFNTDIVKKAIEGLSVLCLYLCVCMSVANIPVGPCIKTRSSNSHNFTVSGVNKVQGRSSLLTTLMTVDVWLDAHTSVDRNALTALIRSRMGLLCTLFLQWCSSWQDFVWHSVPCSLSAVEEHIGYSWSVNPLLWYRDFCGFSRWRPPPSWFLKNSKFDRYVPCRRAICVAVPNFIKIGQTAAEIWLFNGF